MSFEPDNYILYLITCVWKQNSVLQDPYETSPMFLYISVAT